MADSDSNTTPRVPFKKKASNGVLPAHKKQIKYPNHKYPQHYCVICKKDGITDSNYKSHISEKLFGKSSDQ